MRGGLRVDLHGEPASEVTEEQQAHARERLKALAEKRKQSKAQPAASLESRA